MQLTDAFCYILLTITMTATCIEAEGKRHDLEDRKTDRRLNRRDATVLIDTMPAIDRTVLKPKVIYRRISKQNYAHKPKYGPPRAKYGSPKPHRKPNKKFRGKNNPKYGPPGQKKSAPKKRYGPPKRTASKPVYGPPKNKPSFMANLHDNAYRPEPMGFGEPPSYDEHLSPKPDYDDFQKPGFKDFQKPIHSDFRKPYTKNYFKTGSNDFNKPDFSDFRKPKPSDFQKLNFDGFQQPSFIEFPPNQGYGEPPVDSYGAPIKPNLHDLTYPSAQSFPDTTSHFEQDTYSPTLQSWNQQDQNIDSKYAFSNKSPAFVKPENDVFITPVPENEDEELGLNSYSDIYNFRQMKNSIKKKPFQNLKIIRKPWMGMKPMEDEIIVGGQYAEPPARYVPNNTPMFPGNTDFDPSEDLSDPELVASATSSPYDNYRNSNMAFSPQNLNDAFSIVDK